MLLKWSIVKSTKGKNRNDKHIISRTRCFYVIFKSNNEQVSTISQKILIFFKREYDWLTKKEMHIKLVSSVTLNENQKRQLCLPRNLCGRYYYSQLLEDKHTGYYQTASKIKTEGHLFCVHYAATFQMSRLILKSYSLIKQNMKLVECIMGRLGCIYLKIG